MGQKDRIRHVGGEILPEGNSRRIGRSESLDLTWSRVDNAVESLAGGRVDVGELTCRDLLPNRGPFP